jgi:pilus assembly protein CpaE
MSAPRPISEITALLVAPDRRLSGQLIATLPQTKAFQILSELNTYPNNQTLEMRLRQLKPQVLLLDMGSDTMASLSLLKHAVAMNPPTHVVALHSINDSDIVLQSLRAGAVEFLHAPFDVGTQKEAVARLRRLVLPGIPNTPVHAGIVTAFASSKPGAGASTVATQTAFSLHRLTGQRVLLVDCDLTGGTIGFYLKLSHTYSLVDALQNADKLDRAMWNSLTVSYGGVDILPAPAAPFADPIQPARLRSLVEQARELYDWVVLDLPSVFQRTTLAAISECDTAFFITTSELPSLHLTRKAITLVNELGFPKNRFHIIVNRVDRRDDISLDDMEKLFGAKVHTRLPNDYFALHRVVTLGQPLGPDGDLGKAIESIASRMVSAGAAAPKGVLAQV